MSSQAKPLLRIYLKAINTFDTLPCKSEELVVALHVHIANETYVRGGGGGGGILGENLADIHF